MRRALTAAAAGLTMTLALAVSPAWAGGTEGPGNEPPPNNEDHAAEYEKFCRTEDKDAPELKGFTPRTVIVGTQKTVTKKITLQEMDYCWIEDWAISAPEAGLNVDETGDTETWGPTWLTNAQAGRHVAKVHATDANANTAEGEYSFYLKRNGSLASRFNAYPETGTATKTVTGRLTRANWDTASYAGYFGQKVRIDFNPDGPAGWTALVTTTTTKGGYFTKKVAIPTSGSLRATFVTTSTTGAAVSGSDHVKRS